jgi:hypothetical protein
MSETPTTTALPLTPEDEAELRDWVRYHPPSNAQWFARLLATLDRDRQGAVTRALDALAENVRDDWNAAPMGLGRDGVLALIEQANRQAKGAER